MHKVYYLTRQPKGKRPHLQVVCLPVHHVMAWCLQLQKVLQKWKFRKFGTPSRRRNAFQRFLKGQQEQRDSQKRLMNGKANCCTLLRRITNSKVSIQNSSLSTLTPQRRLPHEALWHHVGATIGITLDKNGSLYDPTGTESWNMQTSLDVVGVLSLAPCYSEKTPAQVRPDDQSGYPPNSWIASLAVDSWVGHCPLH